MTVRRAMPQFRLAKVRHPDEIAAAATLFREYVDWLGIDLSFQGFEAELASLPGRYAPPTGELVLACSPAGETLGCVAVRPLEREAVCEMKRLYVRPAASASASAGHLSPPSSEPRKSWATPR